MAPPSRLPEGRRERGAKPKIALAYPGCAGLLSPGATLLLWAALAALGFSGLLWLLRAALGLLWAALGLLWGCSGVALL